MFSKEASKQLRQEFWVSFGKSFPRKWILYNTKIKGLSLKFYFDTKRAQVSMDLEINDLERRINLWERLISLSSILKTEYIPNAIFDDSYLLENQKEISRVYIELDGVSIHNKESWQETMIFFNENMRLFEHFFKSYKEVLSA